MRYVWPLPRRRVNLRARVRVYRLYALKALEALKRAGLDESLACYSCPHYGSGNVEACDYCSAPYQIRENNDAIDEAEHYLQRVVVLD
ncbi:MAG: hypothetical protein DRJ67_01035 [Thermoprotei archaeon]|nr:MAG: hypothetical protein DRJ67_01035 [Thermoprotei archaeon]